MEQIEFDLDLKGIEKRVENLLHSWPMLRSSDPMLIAKYLKDYHQCETFRDYALRKDVPSVESIRRCRQKIQSKGLYQASEATKELRDNAIEKYRSYAINK